MPPSTAAVDGVPGRCLARAPARGPPALASFLRGSRPTPWAPGVRSPQLSGMRVRAHVQTQHTRVNKGAHTHAHAPVQAPLAPRWSGRRVSGHCEGLQSGERGAAPGEAGEAGGVLRGAGPVLVPRRFTGSSGRDRRPSEPGAAPWGAGVS